MIYVKLYDNLLEVIEIPGKFRGHVLNLFSEYVEFCTCPRNSLGR